MRIAIFTESYRPVVNGVSTSIDIFARELRKRSHEIIIFAPSYPGRPEIDPNVVRVSSYTTPFAKDYPLAYPVVPGLRTRFQNLKFDLVHTQAPFAMGRVGMRLARQFGLPLVTTNHTIYTEYTHYVPLFPQWMTRAYLARVMRNYCNRCDYVVTPSESVRDFLQTMGVRTPSRAIPTGPQEELRCGPDPEFPRRHYGIPPEAPLLLFVGRIAREKNMDLLIDAFRQIQAEVPQSYLIIAGSGPYETETRELVARVGLSKQVIFTGFLSRDLIAKCYADSTLFIFPSVTDAQGMVVAEAMIQGLPPVAIGIFGPKEWVLHGKTGLLCQAEAQSLADASLRLIKSPELCTQIGKAAEEFALERSSSRCAGMMIEVYEEAIRRAHK